jgi:hypothetical protein
MRRRSFLKLACAAGLSAGWRVRAFAQSDKVIAGYVRAVAVDGQLSLDARHNGTALAPQALCSTRALQLVT